MDTLKTIEKIAPQRRKMSYEAYLEFAGEAQIVEWVDGEVIVYMPPIRKHQNIVLLLAALLNSFVQLFDLGHLILAPFEVKLWPDGPSREPDIFFVAAENLPKLGEKRFSGGPDLIIEIISTSSASEDRVRKFTQYEQAGVREYWLIDPRPRQQQADFYILGEDELYQAAPIGADGRYHSVVLPNFWLDIDWLWPEPLPNPQRLFAEIMISNDALPAELKETYRALHRQLSELE